MQTTGEIERAPKEGIFLFCLARRDALLVIDGPGLDEAHPVAPWLYRDIVAVWSPVDLEAFYEPSAGDRLTDLAWIGPRTCRHETVIEGIMRHAPVFPARFPGWSRGIPRPEIAARRRREKRAGSVPRSSRPNPGRHTRSWTLIATADSTYMPDR